MTAISANEWLAAATQGALLVAVILGIFIQFRTQRNVNKIEIATNSMKDALVEATDRAAGLAGEKRGRDQVNKENRER